MSKVNLQTQPVNVNRNRTIKKVANAVFTGAGVVGTSALVKGLSGGIENYASRIIENNSTFDTPKQKVGEFLGKTFLKLGEKMFKKGTPVHKLFEASSKNAKYIPAFKATVASLVVGSLIPVAILLKGIYNAGKLSNK